MTTKDGLFLGVDLGGTNIEAAAVQYGEILASKKTQTQAHKGAIIVIERIEKAVREVMTKMTVLNQISKHSVLAPREQ